jgi:hypothetical protein
MSQPSIFQKESGLFHVKKLEIELTNLQFLSDGCGILLTRARIEFSGRPGQWYAKQPLSSLFSIRHHPEM